MAEPLPYVAILFHGQNDYGMPEDWPLEIREIPTASPPDDGRPWSVMSRGDYAAYRLARQAAAQAAIYALPEVISSAKERKFREIDTRTQELIGRGFEFPPGSGVRFSLSMEAQANWLGMQAGRDDPDLQYPIVVNSIDDQATVSLPDSSAVLSFCKVATLTKKAALDSGTALKSLVRAASTLAAIESVTDSR